MPTLEFLVQKKATESDKKRHELDKIGSASWCEHVIVNPIVLLMEWNWFRCPPPSVLRRPL